MRHFPSPTGGSQSGTLHQGAHYVYCKAWGRRQGTASQFNHWWLKTDLDVGPAGQWVSAYYLSRWGNDEARDNDGYDTPCCEVLPYGEIGRKYYAMGGVRSDLGVPVLEEADAQGGGRWQQFHGGVIRELAFGYPLADEEAHGSDGRKQRFELKTLYWTPARGVWAE